jgi:hypothetical protein
MNEFRRRLDEHLAAAGPLPPAVCGAQVLADVFWDQACAGDVESGRFVLDALVDYDPATASAWRDDDAD